MGTLDRMVDDNGCDYPTAERLFLVGPQQMIIIAARTLSKHEACSFPKRAHLTAARNTLPRRLFD